MSAGARSILYGLVLIAAVGCQRWQLDARALVTPQPERQRFEIWSQNHSMVVQGVRVVGDSVWVVPYWKSPGCDSCAVRIARSAVDSVRVQVVDDVRSGVAVGIGTVLLLLGLWLFHGLASLRD